MKKTLTVIIPSYNAEKYLRKGLDSFVAAGTPEDLEVLIINDGSTDGTEAIAHSYEKAYPDTFRVITKENGGHGSGINAGVREAKGKYFKVIDADDWILSENLEAFLETLRNTDADVVFTNFHEVDMQTGTQEAWAMQLPESLYGKTLPFEDLVKHWKEMEKVLQFHGITYNTEFYRKLNYQLLEHIFYEDQEYSTYPLSHASTFLPCNLFIYEYLVGNAEQSVSDANRVKRLWMLKKVIDQLLEGHNKKAEALTTAQKDDFMSAQKVCFTPAQKDYYQRKLQGLVIDYFMISCILNSNKKEGRDEASAFYKELSNSNPLLAANVKKQYLIFRAANALGLNPTQYQQLLRSSLYKKLRG